jgi:Fic family protein
MRKKDFSRHSPGEIVKNLSGDLAFIPFPLPPEVKWTDLLVRRLTEASTALGQLAGSGRKLPNPQRLVRMFLRREAELSSKIENTFATVQTMVLMENLPSVERETPAAKEVNNNFNALEFAIRSAQNRPLSRSLIKEMHAVLLRDVRGHDKTPGKFRTVQAHIGRSANISEARFVPCPPHAIEQCMESLERFLRKPDGMPAVIRAAMSHYQFEAIHPFADGNGRVGRVLLLLQLVKERVLPAPLLNPSAQLERHREAYYDRLLDVSLNGNWNGWFEFFARSIAEEAADALARVERLEALLESYHSKIRKVRVSSLLSAVVDHLFAEPSVTVNSLASTLDIQFSSARKLMDKLLSLGIVREVTGRLRNRVFLAQGVIDIFSTEPANGSDKQS